MLRTQVFENASGWPLSCLENILVFALEQKSKCLIQACIFTAERMFNGVASFSQQTQLKFILESIKHIVEENCQEEFVHIIQYLELIHTLCPDVAPEDYVNSMLKIRQSFILYALLENASASSVCQIMNNFFPEDDLLVGFGIKKEQMKMRFKAVVKRQISVFRKLVGKLLTDMDFRSYYFFDEWVDDFGEMFHSDMKDDLSKYLAEVETQLLTDKMREQISESWLNPEQTSNPVMLRFIKFLVDKNTSTVPEMEIIEHLSWTFPNLDYSLLSMPSDGNLTCPEFCGKVQFYKILQKTCWIQNGRKPWIFSSYNKFLISLQEDLMIVPSLERAIPIESDQHCKMRTPLGTFSESDLNSSNRKTNFRKRKCPIDSKLMTPSKRRRSKSPIKSKLLEEKQVFVNLNINNACKVAQEMESYKAENALEMSTGIDTAACKSILESGSKFFSTARKIHETPLTHHVGSRYIEKQSPFEIDHMHFSDEDYTNSDSEKLNVVDEAYGLTWIPAVCHRKNSNRRRTRGTCRTLCFKSESSEGHVSDSESDQDFDPKPTFCDCVLTDDQVILPDLTIHTRNVYPTNPCYVRLTWLSSQCHRVSKEHLQIQNVRISNKQDVEIIRCEPNEFRFRNYSSAS